MSLQDRPSISPTRSAARVLDSENLRTTAKLARVADLASVLGMPGVHDADTNLTLVISGPNLQTLRRRSAAAGENAIAMHRQGMCAAAILISNRRPLTTAMNKR
jgi:hypothetical protein